MMSKTRREFAPEFKREAVALLKSSRRPLTQVASEFGHPALDAAGMAEDDAGRGRTAVAASAVGRGDDALWPIPSGPGVAERET